MNRYIRNVEKIEEDANELLYNSGWKLLNPLTSEYSSFLWTLFIEETCFNKLGCKREEMNKCCKIVYNYSLDLKNNFYSSLALLLQEKLEYEDDDTVFFFRNRTTAVETTWINFKRNWIRFMFEGESSILMTPLSNMKVLFNTKKDVIICNQEIKRN